MRAHSVWARVSLVKISRDRTVEGVTFEGTRFVCVAVTEVHSEGERREEMRCTKWCGCSGAKWREVSAGEHGKS
jgi:hypothetical protein